MDRRQFLALGALAALPVAGLAVSCDDGSPRPAQRLNFTNRLRIPPVLAPESDGRIGLNMQAGSAELLAGKTAATWGFNGSYLGPTIRLRRGEQVRMAVTNRLPELSTVHWHGIRVPAAMDGGPHQLILPGETWTPQWTVDQPASTCWYHPHPHGSTAMHVHKGLAGLLLVDEPGGPELPDRYGENDIPLILQDKRFTAKGEFAGDVLTGTFGLLGDTMLVNGTHDPYLEVAHRRVRFRVLNASNARMYHLVFADNRRFQVIATDAGLLPAPVEVGTVALTPGERVEIVVEFAAGESAILRSQAREHGMDLNDDYGIDKGDFDILRITAAARLTDGPPVPARLSPVGPVQVPSGAPVRRFTLNGSGSINGREMDPSRIDEVIPAGAKEIWEVRNPGFAHNFHIHEVAFTVLDGGGEPTYGGRKDTVFVPPGKTVRLAVEFGRHTDPRAPYMFHCHILRHEDNGMMGQFLIVEPGTENSVSRHIPGPAHGH
ncbi:copper oxidase [Pseudonocardiaceae bacterium YIM PH 21723]|nr:copper oxidase [Pseudonocardiaceae bacterium YIM PH 21723]